MIRNDRTNLIGDRKMIEEINHHRRRFLATAVITIASAELGMIASAAAQSTKTKSTTVATIKPGTNKSLGL
jgi:hypothetical protein